MLFYKAISRFAQSLNVTNLLQPTESLLWQNSKGEHILMQTGNKNKFEL
jgi:hypothetical protein